MLETVDQIELSDRQRPAHAPPGEIAGALRALAFAMSDDAAQDAYHRVLFAVGNSHAGSYFPIALDAVSFLGEILAAGSRQARARTLEVLIELVGSFGPDPDVAPVDHTRPEDLPEALRARVQSLDPILERLRADPSAPDIQTLARDLLECLAHSVSPQLIALKDWIYEENLRPWLEILSTVVGYDFDGRDWDAVDAGILNTDSELFRWYEFPLGGYGAPVVNLAKEPGSAVVAVNASLPTDLVEPARLAIQIAQSYKLVPRS